jgi:hypothetical protein
MKSYEEFKQMLEDLVEEHGSGDELALVLWNAMQTDDNDLVDDFEQEDFHDL